VVVRVVEVGIDVSGGEGSVRGEKGGVIVIGGGVVNVRLWVD